MERFAGTLPTSLPSTTPSSTSPLLRRLLGAALRAARFRQHRSLRDVSARAGVSLGYLSEIERGRKEPSSELLAAVCAALDISLGELLADVCRTLRTAEPESVDSPTCSAA